MNVSKKRLLVIVIFALLIIGLVAFAYTQPMFRGQRALGKGSAILENPKVKEKLQLTDDQINKIKEVNQDIQKKLIDLRAKEEIAQIELQSLLDASSIDKNAIENKIEEFGKIRTEIHKSEVNRKIAMKEILTPEQQQKIKDFVGKRFAQGFKQGQQGRGGQGFMRGEGFGQGQPGMQGCPMWNQGQCPGFPGMAPAPRGPEFPSAPKEPRQKGKNLGAFEDNPKDEIGISAGSPEGTFGSDDASDDNLDDLALLLN